MEDAKRRALIKSQAVKKKESGKVVPKGSTPSYSSSSTAHCPFILRLRPNLSLTPFPHFQISSPPFPAFKSLSLLCVFFGLKPSRSAFILWSFLFGYRENEGEGSFLVWNPIENEPTGDLRSTGKKRKKEKRKKKFSFNAVYIRMLNWTGVKILNREPNVLYIKYCT